MSHAIEVWRQRASRWVPALAFFVLMVAGFLFYLLNYAGEGAGLERRLGTARGELAEVDERVAELEGDLKNALENSERVRSLYEVGLATEKEKLTKIIAEVKRLAQLSGLEPRRINYPTQEIEDFDLVKRSISFPVVGTYGQLRKMINLLELSDHFLTLEGIQLREADDRGTTLRIQLDVSTLFFRPYSEEEELDLRG